MRKLRLALGTACSALAVAGLLAVAAPRAEGLAAAQPTAAGAQYCATAVKKARLATVQRYRRQMAAQRRAYFRRVHSAKLRKAFVRKQTAQLKALERAAKRCR